MRDALTGTCFARPDVETSLWDRDRLTVDLFGLRSTLGSHGMDLLEATNF